MSEDKSDFDKPIASAKPATDTPHLVVIGSISMDLVVRTNTVPAAGDTVAGHNFASVAGGKGATQAVAAARIGGDVATGNNIAVWILNWTGEGFYPFWAPMTLYYTVADSLNCVAGAIIGASVLLALKRSRIKTITMEHNHSK